MNNLKITYVRRKNAPEAITIVSNLLDEGLLDYAVAFCSANDAFNKKVGRELAIERLENPSPEYSGTLKVKNYKGMLGPQKLDYILLDILMNLKYPKWAKEFILYYFK